MSANYILEYTCTDAEMREARSLGLRKTRQLLWVSIIYLLFLVAIYFRIRDSIAPKNQPFFIAMALGLLLLFHLGSRSRKKQLTPTRLELSEKGLSFLSPGANVEMRWTAFSKRLESQTLFVLLDRPQRLIYALPKRAFPNEEAIIWFRGCTERISTNQVAAPKTPPQNAVAAATDGVSISYELLYSDYLSQMLASWRFKGVFLLVYVVIFGQALFDGSRPSSGNVNSPLTVLLWVLSPITAMLLLFLFGIPFLRLRAHRKHSGPQQAHFGENGIQFVERNASGTLPWSTYRYFKETRSGFILWKPGGVEGSVATLFPKRAFASSSDIQLTRSLLNRHMRASRWYF